MDAYKKTMDELSAAAEQAKAIGQPTAAEEVARLNTLYGEMQEQVQAQQTKLEAAVALREAYYAAKAEMETCLKTCHEQLEAVSVLGVSVPTKLDRYKVRNAVPTFRWSFSTPEVLRGFKSIRAWLGLINEHSCSGVLGSHSEVFIQKPIPTKIIGEKVLSCLYQLLKCLYMTWRDHKF